MTPPFISGILVATTISIPFSAFGTSCHSVADGEFTNVSVWDCGCVPTACDTVVVSHQLVASEPIDLSAQFLWVTSQGRINTTSTLLWTIASLSVLIDGELTARLLEIHTMDSVVNNGSILVDTLLLYEGQFMNYGSVEVPSIFGHTYWSDRFWNYGDMTCGWMGSYTPAAFVNNGYLVCTDAQASFMYSSGTIMVDGSLVTTVDLVISEGGTLQVADTLCVVQYMDNYGYIGCGQFMNGDTIGTAISHIYSDGLIQCNGFVNRESGNLYGPGTLCIAGHSENHGVIGGPIRVCDTTPTSLDPPYMDIHDGLVSLPVSGCSGNVCSVVGMAESTSASFMVLSPQPAVGAMTITGSRLHEAATIVLTNATGRVVSFTAGPFGDHVTIDRKELKAGLYLIVMEDPHGRPIASARALFVD